MAKQKEINTIARKLFDRQQEMLSALPPADRENLRLLIFLSVQTSLEITKLLLTTGNTSQVNQVIDELESLMRSSLPKVNVKVRSATELSTADREKLINLFQGELDKEVVLHVTVDKKLLGGLVVEYQGRIIDLTVDEELSRLKQHLLKEIKTTK